MEQEQMEAVALALLLWICSLPLVALAVIPVFGLKAAAAVALVLFFVAAAGCWGTCGWRIARD